MSARRLAFLLLVLAACGEGRGGALDASTNTPDLAHRPDDHDGDGYTPAEGDCDDANAAVGPGAVELPENGIDDDCDGQIDNLASCDGATLGMKTADALAQAIGLCDPRFVLTAGFDGPSDPRARNILGALGVVTALEGASMAYLSTGEAAGLASYVPQPGTSFGEANTFSNPVLTLPPQPPDSCGGAPPALVNDYTEYVLTLKVPSNVSALSFKFQFFSTEYPEYVCQMYNDRFLVVLQDLSTNALENIAFDSALHPVSVNNSFFTVCTNTGGPQTMHCTHPITDIKGSGYDKPDHLVSGVELGGSTGWLTTTAPVVPGATIKLRYIVYDEFDHIYDSSVLIDDFRWVTDQVSGPVTVP